MHLRVSAIVVAVRQHGEHGAIVRALTRDHGVQPGYVRGGRSRRMRPILQPANIVAGEWRARTGEQLASLGVELVHSRAALHGAPLAAAALPEGQAYPRIHDALDGVLGAIEAAPSARGWAAALVRYELLLLAELGFGLDLDRCVASGAEDDIGFVSPGSGGAVSRGAALGYEARLLPCPAFLRSGEAADWPQVFDGLKLTGHFLARDILVDRRAEVLTARERLVDRLKRAVA